MKVSIVTPSFNQCAFLRRTMASVLGQRGPFELRWIVVDGGSTDGTVELLRSIDDARVCWVSEPDRGQSHAINKGLATADGDVVAWLNSDDLYAEGALAEVCRCFQDHPDAQWLVGRCDVIDAGDREVRRGVTRYKNGKLSRYNYRTLLRENFISQPAVFWRRAFGERLAKAGHASAATPLGSPVPLGERARGDSAQKPSATENDTAPADPSPPPSFPSGAGERAPVDARGRATAGGLLDESLHWTMDYDLWLRMGRVAAPLVVDRTLALFRMHGQSKSGQVDRRQFDEGYAVALRYVGRDRVSRWAHRLNVEKIVGAYRLMRLVGR